MVTGKCNLRRIVSAFLIVFFCTFNSIFCNERKKKK